MNKKFLLPFILLIVFILPIKAIKFGGLVQTWFSYAESETKDYSSYGFGVKRLEFNPYGSISDKIDWGFMVGWDNNAVRLFDAYLNFKFSTEFRIKVGRFSVPGTVSASLSPSGALDLIERAAITMHWGGNNSLFGERSWGIQAYGEIMDKKLYYAFMIANNGAFGDSFTPSIKSAIHIYENSALYLWGRLEAKPICGMRIGAFFGTGQGEADSLNRKSYGAHIFYLKKGLNIKFEYIAGENENDGIPNLKYDGLYLILGYKVGKIEPVIRFDTVKPNDGVGDPDGVIRYKNISAGINYNYNKRIRFQANYVIKNESMVVGMDKLKNNLFYINIQYGY